MSKIRIKNFGPIQEGYLENDGWIDIKKVTLFIGNQGSGKSTIAKVFSTLTWLEKAINRGDVNVGNLTHDAFYSYFEYQRIKNYFRTDTVIEFIGDSAKIKYSKSLKYPEVELIKNRNFRVPKIMYVPAERNFLSVVKNAYGLKNLPDTLYTFAEELRKGQIELNGALLQLPISDLEHKFEYKYNNENETSYIIGANFELNLLESSSGFQSLVPLFLVTKFLTDELQKGKNVLREQLNVEQSVRRSKEINDILFNHKLSTAEKIFKQIEIDSKYLNTCFINIVEEPEQNLYPKSQWQLLKKLLEYTNKIDGNKLIITTHSPYLVNYLTIAIQGAYLGDKINGSSNSNLLNERLNSIVPIESLVSVIDTVIYQLDETNGTIARLPDPEGIPSDKNYLNQSIAEGNRLFDALLEIEEEL